MSKDLAPAVGAERHAGSVDVIGFLSLGGLFTAHITGEYGKAGGQ